MILILILSLYCNIKPLTDARLYSYRDICRILEVNGGKDFINDHPMVIESSSLLSLFFFGGDSESGVGGV